MKDNIETEAYKEPVAYIVYQDTMTRLESAIRKLIVALVVTIVLMFASNIAWLIAWNMYDYESTSVVVDGDSKGNANYVGANGYINNGEGGSDKENSEAEER